MDKPKILTRKELRVIMPRLAGWKLAGTHTLAIMPTGEIVQWKDR